MKRIKSLISLAGLSLLLLAACDGSSEPSSSNPSSRGDVPVYDSSVGITIDGLDNGTVISPEDIILTETLNSLEGKKQYNMQTLPSTGDVNILVIPIMIQGYEEIDIDGDGTSDNDRVLSDIEKAFFSHDDSSVFKSVSDFYYESSFGKLNISGEVTPFFSVADSSLEFETAADIGLNDTYSLVQEAVDWVKETSDIDMTQFDSDQDGYIDGVWCIYSAPNYTNGGPQSSDDGNNYWAYTSWGNQTPGSTSVNGGESPNVNDPVYNLFGWASYDFLYESYGTQKLDTHTFIHETGHFLGLNDYYSDLGTYSPIGKVDMMDGNIIDLNSYSKMTLGWTKPYLVTGDASITLKSMQNENSLIVIPDDSYAKDDFTKFNPFGEYVLIELYSNEGLNYDDSRVQVNDRPLAPNGKGVRIYHVDARVMVIDKTDLANITVDFYEDGDTIDTNHRIIAPITNSLSSNTYNYNFNVPSEYNMYDEIRMIEENGRDTFSSGGYQKMSSYFKEGDSFSFASYSGFFTQSSTFNNGNAFSKTVTVGEVK